MEQKVNDNEIIKSFNNQIAGHKHNFKFNSPGSIGLVKFGDDFVLKPITKPRQGHTEITFYQEIWSAEDSIVGLLKLYVPKYHGLVTLRLDGVDMPFLKLQDLTIGLKKPCIADIKIGAQTWEPNVDQQKRIAEDMKYIETKKAYGISLTGYQVFDLTTGQLIRRDKSFGKNLTKDTIFNALEEFFNVKARGSFIVVQQVLERLSDMLSWWHQQKVVNIYGSSVLILYDAWELDYLFRQKDLQLVQEQTTTEAHIICDIEANCTSPTGITEDDLTNDQGSLNQGVNAEPAPLENNPRNSKINTTDEEINETNISDRLPSNIPWIRVYMIDFAHVVYPYKPKSDTNYINGLTNLIKLVQKLR